MYWCLKNVKLVFDELSYVFILVYQGKLMISLKNFKTENWQQKYKIGLQLHDINYCIVTFQSFLQGLQSNQHIGLYSSTYMNPQQVVPGMGVSWQHSVPNNMPWTDQVYGTVNSGVTTFSGKPTVSQSYSTV